MSNGNGWKNTAISALIALVLAGVSATIVVGGGKADQHELDEAESRIKTVEEFVVEQKVLNARVEEQNKAIRQQLDELPEKIAKAVKEPQ